jgi:hypothetical protein
MMIRELLTSEGKNCFHLEGDLNELAQFDSIQFENSELELHFDLFGIRRINSNGAKNWMRFLDKPRSLGYSFKFHRVSVAVVEQLNLIPTFCAGGEIVSATLPYVCKLCKQNNDVVKTKADMEFVNLDRTNWECRHCGKQTLIFDEMADEYLQFWNS